jgi:CheY-like chemotaxis protein
MSAGRILVVEDNALNAELVTFVLTQDGYDVRLASDANAVYEVLRDFCPDLILMDIQLPGKSGLDLARSLKADPSYRYVPIVALTAYAMKGDEQKARAAGCDGYVTKPIDIRNFGAVVAEYIARGSSGSPGS